MDDLRGKRYEESMSQRSEYFYAVAPQAGHEHPEDASGPSDTKPFSLSAHPPWHTRHLTCHIVCSRHSGQAREGPFDALFGPPGEVGEDQGVRGVPLQGPSLRAVGPDFHKGSEKSKKTAPPIGEAEALTPRIDAFRVRECGRGGPQCEGDLPQGGGAPPDKRCAPAPECGRGASRVCRPPPPAPPSAQ